MKKLKRYIRPLFLSAMILGSGVAVLAYDNEATGVKGYWTSDYLTDWNGVSGVGTKYTSSNAAYYALQVYTGSGSTVGSKSGTVGQNESIEHTCWGQPGISRRGVVSVGGVHNPWFNA